MTIKSKIFNFGNEQEAEWPARGPSKRKRGLFHWDKETQTFKEGRRPNPNNNFGTAPMVVFDSMPPQYHERAGRVVESRSEWERIDQETGSLTFGSTAEPRKYVEKGNNEWAKQLKEDRRNASLEAIRKVRANPKEINQKLNKVAEKQKKTAKKIADNYGLNKEFKDKGII